MRLRRVGDATVIRFRKSNDMLIDAAAVAAQYAESLAEEMESLGARTDAQEIVERATQCREAAQAAVTLLVRAGAEAPNGAPTEDELSLDELAQLRAMDTPTARELLAGLERLLPLADRVDASRSRGDGTIEPYETMRTALAEVATRLRLETCGPCGRD